MRRQCLPAASPGTLTVTVAGPDGAALRDSSGVGDPDTGHGWLTDMHTYITTTHDRAREDRSPRLRNPPSPATTNQQGMHPYGKDDPAPF